MRKFILIAAMVLMSAGAQAAGVSRGLTMASNDELAVAEQPKAAEAPKADVPKFVERPAAVEPTGDRLKDQTRFDRSEPPPHKSAEKPKHKRESTEARVIYELHRHGIYW